MEVKARNGLCVVIFAVLALSGCSKGLDRKLDSSSADALSKSIELIANEASEKERAVISAYYREVVFSFMGAALSGNAPDLSNKTGREFFAAYIKNKIAAKQREIASLDAGAAATKELKKISFSDIKFSKSSSDFMSMRESEVSLSIKNNSSLKVSSMWVRTKIYVDGGDVPEAKSKSVLVFVNGFEPGQTIREKYNPRGFFDNEGGWDKMTIKKSNSQRLEVEVVSVEDYGKNMIEAVDEYSVTKAQSELSDLNAQLKAISG